MYQKYIDFVKNQHVQQQPHHSKVVICISPNIDPTPSTCISSLASIDLNIAKQVCISDTGASDHMICSLSLFSSPPKPVHINIQLLIGTTTTATHKGHVTLLMV